MTRSLDPRMDRKHEEQRRWIEGMLVSAQKRKWYGKITLDIKRGLIDKAVSEESLKPPSTSG